MYEVKLTVVDVAGQTDNTSQSVTIAVQRPRASFTWSQDPYYADCFSFDATESTGYQIQYSWNYSDGYTDSGSQLYHCFITGTYAVTLTVTDGVGQSDGTTQYVTAS